VREHVSLVGQSKAVDFVPLSEVVDINPRFEKGELEDGSLASFIPMKCVEEESGRFEPLGDRKVAEVRKGYTPFRDGDVIFAKVTPCMENGKAAVVKGLTNGIGFGSTEFFALRPKNGLDANYLLHFILQSQFRRNAARNMTGAVGLRRVPKSYLEQQPIPVPALHEQRRIVAEIEKQFTRLEAGVAALRRVQANLKRYRAAVLKAACEGRLVPTEAELAKAGKADPNFETGEALLARILTERRNNWQGRGKYKEPAALATADLSPLPEGWAWTNIGQVAEIGTGATPNRGKSEYYVDGTIPWITSGRVNDSRITEADQFVTPTALAQCNLTIYPRGTLLLAMYGEGKTRGMASELEIEATTNQALAAIQTASTIKSFVKVVLWKNYEDVRKTASGGVQPNLNLSIVRAIQIPLPPLAEQTRIVAEVERRLSVVEELETVVAANLQRAKRLRQAILASAFSPAAP
jgi:type I restriction enzyme, S subunit